MPITVTACYRLPPTATAEQATDVSAQIARELAGYIEVAGDYVTSPHATASDGVITVAVTLDDDLDAQAVVDGLETILYVAGRARAGLTGAAVTRVAAELVEAPGAAPAVAGSGS